MNQINTHDTDHPHKDTTIVIGFDYGLARIGVAVGQTITGSASEIGTVKANQGKPDWQTITTIIEKWQPEALVIGIPLNEDGTDSSMTEKAKKFSRQLHGRYHLPVHTTNEYLTSFAAESLPSHTSTIKYKRNTDSIAACLILEQWFYQHKNPLKHIK